ncbi:hypothetical protein [Modestobacter sp. URMC 112]
MPTTLLPPRSRPGRRVTGRGPVRARVLRTPVVLAAAAGLTLSGLALAGPAAAIEDPRRPVVTVTHGPSCGPGAVRVHVTNGTEAHRVALVLDGDAEQQAAALGPGQEADLGSADVAWGTTVAVTVTVRGAGGAAEPPLDLGTYTRPSWADCDALEPRVPAPGVPGQPVELAGSPAADPVAPVPAGAATAVGVAASVAPGGVVTVRGSGFSPGEAVDVSLSGGSGVLATVVAAADGAVEAVVQIPRGTDLGPVSVQLVGRTSSAVSGLDLQVAARPPSLAESSTSMPVVAAGTALLVAGAALGAATARRTSRAVRPAPAPWA